MKRNRINLKEDYWIIMVMIIILIFLIGGIFTIRYLLKGINIIAPRSVSSLPLRWVLLGRLDTLLEHRVSAPGIISMPLCHSRRIQSPHIR